MKAKARMYTEDSCVVNDLTGTIEFNYATDNYEYHIHGYRGNISCTITEVAHINREPVWSITYSSIVDNMNEEAYEFLRHCLLIGNGMGCIKGPRHMSLDTGTDTYIYSYITEPGEGIKLARETITCGGKILFSSKILINENFG